MHSRAIYGQVMAIVNLLGFVVLIFNSGWSISSPEPLNQYSNINNKASGESIGVAVGIYSYYSEHDDELSFCEGDIIEIVKQDDSGWSEGILNGKRGWIPSNYVEIKKYENM